MLITDRRLVNLPVMSLQTGTELARTERPVIDPRNLCVVAFELIGPNLDIQPSLLRIEDIRENGSLGLIVDSSDEFVAVDDVIKLQQIYNYNFNLVDLPVIDADKRKLGRVSGFTVEPGNFVIQQLQVKRPILKSLGDTEILVHRNQITSVSDERIIVKSTKKSAAEPLRQTMPSFSNPFRSAS